MRWTPLLLLGCFPDFDETKGLSFVDNPEEDYDGDGEKDATDCDDGNPDITFPLTYYADLDSDGFANEGDSLEACPGEQPTGYILVDTTSPPNFDCDDGDPELHPADYDQDGQSSCDGDCDDRNASVTGTLTYYFDADADGFGVENNSVIECPGDQPAGYIEAKQRNGENVFDCDDLNLLIHPDAQEICDNVDNNCSGEIDDYSGSLAPRWYYDGDNDGFGQYEVYQQTCVPSVGYVDNFLDCDDGNANVYPGAEEVCDGVDNNCNGGSDEALATDAITWYQDSDNDGYGNPSVSQPSCDQPNGFITTAGDCNDLDPNQYPNADEYCNNQDDDCDGNIDEGIPVDAVTSYEDADGDSYGDTTRSYTDCTVPLGYVITDGDCDDDDVNINPDAAELCNNIDDNCDQSVDNDAIDKTVYYIDEDCDGYGVPGIEHLSCPEFNVQGEPVAPMGYSAFDTDCDDSQDDLDGDGVYDGTIRSPGNIELCSNDIDENCDGHNTAGATDVSSFLLDADGDTYGSGVLAPDGSLAFQLDSCIQPYGYILYQAGDPLDCNDTDDWVHPHDDTLHLDEHGDPIDHQELCNGKLDLCENDPSGGNTTPTDEIDHDTDGYVECSLDVDPLQWADLSLGVVGGDDCDSLDATIHPGALELCSGIFENCTHPMYGLTTAPLDETDDDQDGYVECDDYDSATWEGPTSIQGGSDCNDTNVHVFPGAAPLTSATACVQDLDGDGYADNSWDLCPLVQNLEEAEHQLLGQRENEEAGISVASAGDVDGDGLDDILIGTDTESAYLMLGSTLQNTGSLTLSTADYTFVGENSDDKAGRFVASAGDVDGDGLDDILIAAPNNDVSGEDAGKVYLIYGSSLGSSNSMDLSNADVHLFGENTDDKAGSSIASAGDVDGDGLDDVLIGAYDNDDGGVDSGKGYLFLGSSLGNSTELFLANADYSFVGENTDDKAGNSIASAGDVDGDGLDDVLIGAHYNDDAGLSAGKGYLIFASSLTSTAPMDLHSADVSFLGEGFGDYAGYSLSGAGDVDGDGLDDILIGAYGASGGGYLGGQAYLMFSASLGAATSINLANADHIFIGEGFNNFAGHSVASAGDTDGDGLSDILIGAHGNSVNGSFTGKGYLLFGASLSSPTVDLANANHTFTGQSGSNSAGYSISSAGDVDGDGLNDVLIGAYGNGDNGANAGKAAIFSACEN